MEKKLGFVLGGGGSHGALQVGALRAVLEAGLFPDFLIGTSIGASNAVFLAIHGYNPAALDLLCQAWKAASHSNFMPAILVRLKMLTDELRTRTGLPLLGVVSMRIDDSFKRKERGSLIRFASASLGLVGLFAVGLAVTASMS